MLGGYKDKGERDGVMEESTGNKEKRKCFICKGDIKVVYSGEIEKRSPTNA